MADAARKSDPSDFAQGSLTRIILHQAVPVMLAQIAQMLYNIVDRIYIGHMPGTGEAALSGVGLVFPIITIIAAFTGLYGTASQQLADSIEATAPALAHANPLWQTTNCFYSLLYYDTPSAFLESFVALLIMALVFLALASMRMRRTSYDHL